METRSTLRIAFVGRFYWHNGSSHALLGYVRAGRKLNYDVRVSALGVFDEVVGRNLPVADADWKPDVMAFVFEERFLREKGFEAAERLVPRSRRLVIDPDGKYFEPVTAGTDTNHPTADSRAVWSADFERLSDTILQPRLGPGVRGTESFLYFGVDRHREHQASDRGNGHTDYDLVYVGSNWYRWHDIVWLLGGLAPVRQSLGRMAVFGRYWSGEPLNGYEEFTSSSPEYLRAHGVETHDSVPFDAVESTMAKGRLNPILVRPILNELNLVTPRMFETFAAGTVPILPPYMRHAPALYGAEVAPLCLPDDPGDAVVSILDDYDQYRQLAEDIRAKLARDHNYEKRLEQLLGFVDNL
jgi:glycosyltransferase involved in cell wall biosynthesis